MQRPRASKGECVKRCHLFNRRQKQKTQVLKAIWNRALYRLFKRGNISLGYPSWNNHWMVNEWVNEWVYAKKLLLFAGRWKGNGKHTRLGMRAYGFQNCPWHVLVVWLGLPLNLLFLDHRREQHVLDRAAVQLKQDNVYRSTCSAKFKHKGMRRKECGVLWLELLPRLWRWRSSGYRTSSRPRELRRLPKAAWVQVTGQVDQVEEDIIE